ncbi:MAG: hypothetical protein LBV21_06750 [Candidatus Adiutrix sp.]|nr:hypothetical protein [Candidatus Adiutrix sp.]
MHYSLGFSVWDPVCFLRWWLAVLLLCFIAAGQEGRVDTGSSKWADGLTGGLALMTTLAYVFSNTALAGRGPFFNEVVASLPRHLFQSFSPFLLLLIFLGVTNRRGFRAALAGAGALALLGAAGLAIIWSAGLVGLTDASDLILRPTQSWLVDRPGLWSFIVGLVWLPALATGLKAAELSWAPAFPGRRLAWWSVLAVALAAGLLLGLAHLSRWNLGQPPATAELTRTLRLADFNLTLPSGFTVWVTCPGEPESCNYIQLAYRSESGEQMFGSLHLNAFSRKPDWWKPYRNSHFNPAYGQLLASASQALALGPLFKPPLIFSVAGFPGEEIFSWSTGQSHPFGPRPQELKLHWIHIPQTEGEFPRLILELSTYQDQETWTEARQRLMPWRAFLAGIQVAD